MEHKSLVCIHRNRLFSRCLAQTLAGSVSAESPTTYEARPVDMAMGSQMLDNLNGAGHIVMIDLSYPGDQVLCLTQQCLAAGQRAMLMTSSIEPDSPQFSTINQCLDAGAHGYVFEDASVEELVTAIQVIQRGELYCSPQIFSQLFKQFAKLSRASNSKEPPSQPRRLTDRELQILHWIAEGYSNKQVARQLSLSIYTVKNHVHRILNKLNASDRAHAVRHAMEANWLPLREAPFYSS